MLRRKDYKWIVLSLCIIFSLSGCDKQADTVTDYGKTSAEQTTEKDAEHEDNTELMNRVPETNADGTPVWEKNFAIENVPISISINSIQNTIDQLRAYRSLLITEDNVHEDEVVRGLFGDTAEKLTCKMGEYDGQLTRAAYKTSSLYISYHPEVAVKEPNGVISYPSDDFPLWLDEENGWYHLWQGQYQDVMYQLLIGYDREKGRKDICFWPVNPGEMIGRPECTDVSSFSQYNGFTVGGRMIYDIMADRSNETKADLFELRNKAGSFARQYLRTTLWEEDIELENGSETYQLVFRQGIDPDYDYSKVTKTIPDCDNPDKMYLNGYELGYCASHRSFKEYEENTLSADRNDYPGNSGEFWVINTGVLACDLYIWDEPVEELAEGTFILAFDTLMESFCEQLTERLDVSNLSGYELSCTSAQLIFYPIPSEVSKQEVTYVPAWGVVLGGRGGPWTDTLGVKVILNAIDGKMLLFDQTMIDYN